MALDVLDGGGNPQTVKTSLSGSDHVPHHNVDTLPTAFTTDTTAVKVAVQALAALISAGRFAVELNGTLTGYLANLATLGGAVTGARLAVNVDSTTTGKLDSIITALGSYLSTLAGTVSAGRVAVDLTSTITGYLANLTNLANAASGTAASVAMTTTSATLIAANANRIGLIICNPLSVVLYVRFESADAAAIQTVQVPAGSAYEMPKRYYSGIVKAAVASGSGNVFVTEFT